jgi:hypothetical protein
MQSNQAQTVDTITPELKSFPPIQLSTTAAA